MVPPNLHAIHAKHVTSKLHCSIHSEKSCKDENKNSIHDEKEVHKRICQNCYPLTMLTWQQVKFEWTPMHHTAFLQLKEAIIQAPILHYPDPNKKYIVYTDASDDSCGAQLSQEHDGVEFPVVCLLHTFTETQRKWSTTEQEA